MATPIKNTVTENAALSEAEFAPSAKELAQIASSCVGRALSGPGGLSQNDKSLLNDKVGKVRENLAKAIDIVKKKRSRINIQRDRLAAEAREIGTGNDDFANFHRLAARAIQNCQEASIASANAKAGLDMVFSRQIEINYRMSLLDVLESRLAEEQKAFSSAMTTLDSMTVATQ